MVMFRVEGVGDFVAAAAAPERAKGYVGGTYVHVGVSMMAGCGEYEGEHVSE